MLAYKMESVNPTDSDSMKGKKDCVGGKKERRREAGEICNDFRLLLLFCYMKPLILAT